MMHGMLWVMIAAGTLKLVVLALAVLALVKYLFFTSSRPTTHMPPVARAVAVGADGTTGGTK